MRTRKPSGFVVWRGPSVLTGEPIVLIMTGIGRPSSNVKTGAMLQTHILTDGDDPPNKQAAVCGDCRHRSGSCYVQWWRGPRSVWAAFRRGSYPSVTLTEAHSVVASSGRALRIGTEGDPAAIPSAVWFALAWGARASGTGWTGYTHQWRRPDAAVLRGLCMASVDTPAEAAEARALGWRTFRVNRDGTADPTEIVCPASAEAGRRTTCEDCRLCGGLSTPARNVTIKVHGSSAVMKAFEV